MGEAGHESTPFVATDGILDGSGAAAGSYLTRAGKAAAGTYATLASIAPPRADFVDAYRSAFGEEPTDNAAAAYACVQVILASLHAIAADGPVRTGSGKLYADMPSIPTIASKPPSAPWASTPTATRRSKWCRCIASIPREPTVRATGSS